MGIKIKFIGHNGVRELNRYVWNKENGWIQEVDPETAANLISYPRPNQFAMVAGQKLSKGDEDELNRHLGVKVKDIEVVPEVVAPPPVMADAGLSEERISQFAELGISDLTALAALDAAAVKEAANKTGATRKEISGWVSKAQELTSSAN